MIAKSNTEPKKVLLFNPTTPSYLVRWDVVEVEGGYDYQEKLFIGKPTLEQVKDLIDSYYNKKCDEEIVSGYSYEGVPVWLSQENQLNFKAAFDLCLQLEGATLPLKFKFGTNTKPVYKEFTNVEDLKAFYVDAITYIQSTLHKYWDLKDAVNLDEYELPD